MKKRRTGVATCTLIRAALDARSSCAEKTCQLALQDMRHAGASTIAARCTSGRTHQDCTMICSMCSFPRLLHCAELDQLQIDTVSAVLKFKYACPRNRVPNICDNLYHITFAVAASERLLSRRHRKRGQSQSEVRSPQHVVWSTPPCTHKASAQSRLVKSLFRA